MTSDAFIYSMQRYEDEVSRCPELLESIAAMVDIENWIDRQELDIERLRQSLKR